MKYNLVTIGSHVKKIHSWNPKKEFPLDLFDYIDLGSIDKDLKKINKDQVLKVLGNNAPSRARQQVIINDILVSTVRPNLNGVAFLDQDFLSSTASTGYCVLRCKPSLFSKYLFYWVQSKTFVKDMIRKATGANYPAVSDKIIKDSKIPLPPLHTQKKIAEILDTADSLRRKDKALIDKYNQLTQSLFLEMFGDPVKNPKNWNITSVINILKEKVKAGLYVAPQNYTNENGFEMVHMSDAFYDIVKLGKLKRVKISESDLEKYALSENDILIARRSLTYEGAAKPCRIPKIIFPLVYESSLIRVKVNADIMLPIFFYYFFSNERARKSYILKHVTKSTISGINQAGLNAIKIFTPPIDLQNKFATLVEQIETQKKLAEQNLQKSEALFNSLLQKAFKGELVADKPEHIPTKETSLMD